MVWDDVRSAVESELMAAVLGDGALRENQASIAMNL